MGGGSKKRWMKGGLWRLPHTLRRSRIPSLTQIQIHSPGTALISHCKEPAKRCSSDLHTPHFWPIRPAWSLNPRKDLEIRASFAPICPTGEGVPHL
jgi:hypothetical protein